MIAENRIDFIGDIHGHADELENLLNKLGYSKLSGSYKHPDRTAFFVGDYIDPGPEIPKTLDIVRSIVGRPGPAYMDKSGCACDRKIVRQTGRNTGFV